MPKLNNFSKLNQRGYSQISLVALLLVLLVGGVVLYFYYQRSTGTDVLAATVPITLNAGDSKTASCSGDRITASRGSDTSVSISCSGKQKILPSLTNIFTSSIRLGAGQSALVNCLGTRLDARKSGTKSLALTCYGTGTTPPPPAPVCGDGVCDSNESVTSCPVDCQGAPPPTPPPTTSCGNGACELGETAANCPTDCGVTTPPPPTGTTGLPFGPFHLPTTSYGVASPAVFTGGFLNLEKESVSSATTKLEAAKAAGLRLIVSVTGGGSSYSDSAGSYVYSMFQDEVDELKTLDLEKYYKDGVVLGNMMMDEPQDANNWNGTQISTAQIKEAAAYLKTVWPSVPVGVGSNPDYLKDGGFSSKDLDFVSYPFTSRKLCAVGSRDGCYGTTKEQVIANLVTSAKDANLGLALSINPLADSPAMAPATFQSYGEHFAKNDSGYACAFTIWRWDSPDANGDGQDWFSESSNPGITAALNAVLVAAKTHTSSVSCKAQ